MKQYTSFPQCLEPYLIGDQAFAAAYEDCSSLVRAGIKTAIARHYALYAPSRVLSADTLACWEHGFYSRTENRPVDWTLICIDAYFASAPRLLGALLPALQAGVPDVAVVRVCAPDPSGSGGDTPFPAVLLTALELAGQECVCQLDEQTLADWLPHCAASGPGRVIFLGSECGGMSARAAKLDIPVFSSCAAPCIGVAGLVPEDRALLAAAHPDAAIITLDDDAWPVSGEGMRLDAIVSPAGRMREFQGAAPLLFSPEHLWCWFFSHLQAFWFFTQKISLWNAEELSGGEQA